MGDILTSCVLVISGLACQCLRKVRGLLLLVPLGGR